MDKVNIAEKFANIPEPWKPHIAGELNGQYVKLGKFKGEFVWHHHENEDELFLVTTGQIRIDFRDRSVTASSSRCARRPDDNEVFSTDWRLSALSDRMRAGQRREGRVAA